MLVAAGSQGAPGALILAPAVQCWAEEKGEHDDDRTGGRPWGGTGICLTCGFHSSHARESRCGSSFLMGG